jgi:transcription elongation GreA/GreB family factor
LSVNKTALREQIIAQLTTELATQTAAAHLARDEAISDESRAASKYDTHSQEAAYLAEGQARLANEIQANLAFYQTLPLSDFAAGTPITIGAVVELKSAGRSSWYFIGPRAGGLELPGANHSTLVLTPQSPLGQQLLGRREGETITVAARGKNSIQLIVSVR